ncbi:hypothetical protein DL771_004906 [Monosporascus sp. 5C6A]|nr:hypothetical protein DL771_004906 [Monosporascus sp. 5C6A]
MSEHIAYPSTHLVGINSIPQRRKLHPVHEPAFNTTARRPYPSSRNSSMETTKPAARSPGSSGSGSNSDSSKTIPTPSPVDTWLRETPRDAPWSAVNPRLQQAGEPRAGAGDPGGIASRL